MWNMPCTSRPFHVVCTSLRWMNAAIRLRDVQSANHSLSLRADKKKKYNLSLTQKKFIRIWNALWMTLENQKPWFKALSYVVVIVRCQTHFKLVEDVLETHDMMLGDKKNYQQSPHNGVHVDLTAGNYTIHVTYTSTVRILHTCIYNLHKVHNMPS